MPRSNNKRIVVIGGGTGTFTVLTGCSSYPFDITAIVSTADDGGSSGILRDELGVLPPGDIRQALVALSSDASILRKLFTYRFDSGNLKGHQFGNLFLSALEKVTGSFDKAVIEAGKILAVKGTVVPVTIENVSLHARAKNGDSIAGQHAIDEYIWSDTSSIDSIWLEPKKCQLYPSAKLAIQKADLIVIGPGSVFTSLIPNLLVAGMKTALQETKAKIVYVANLMTEKGQTGSYCVQDYVKLLEKYIGTGHLDYVIYNTKKPSQLLLTRYRQEMERRPVELDTNKISPNYTLIGEDLISQKRPKMSNADTLSSTRSLIRHDGQKLARIFFELCMHKGIHART